jgi:hypothetical protein
VGCAVVVGAVVGAVVSATVVVAERLVVVAAPSSEEHPAATIEIAATRVKIVWVLASYTYNREPWHW